MSNERIDREAREYLRYLRDLHFTKQGGRCYYCDCVMTPVVEKNQPPTMVTLEHLNPIKYGGGHNIINTAAACKSCNEKRGSKVHKPLLRVKKTFSYSYVNIRNPDVLNLINLSEPDPHQAKLRIQERDNTEVKILSRERLHG